MKQQHPIVIIGGGGHTRVLIGILKRANMPIKGILTRDKELLGTEIHGVDVLGLEDVVNLTPTQDAVVIGVGNKASGKGSGLAARAEIYRRYSDAGYFIPPIISESAILQPDITLGKGVQILPGVVIQPGAMIGENVIINTRASIDHDVVIYPHAHIAPGAILCGGVVVGEQSHIGAGATIIQNVKIGNNVVIGAGAVVTRDVEDGAVIRPAASK